MLERHYRELLNFLVRLVGDRHAAADLTQESYARVLALQQGGATVFDGRALLYRTARNLVVDRHRRAALRQHDALEELADDEHPSAPPRSQPEEALASRQDAQACLAAIEALPPRCREAFVLHLFDELSHARIAERMGISVSMVEKHVARGLLACRAAQGTR